MQFADFAVEVLDLLLVLLHGLLVFFYEAAVLLYGLILFLVLHALLHKGDLFGVNLLLQLVNLVIDDLIAAFDFGDLVLRLREVLAIGVAV